MDEKVSPSVRFSRARDGEEQRLGKSSRTRESVLLAASFVGRGASSERSPRRDRVGLLIQVASASLSRAGRLPAVLAGHRFSRYWLLVNSSGDELPTRGWTDPPIRPLKLLFASPNLSGVQHNQLKGRSCVGRV